MLGGPAIAIVQIGSSDGIVSAFSNDAEVISVGVQVLVAGSLLFFIYGFQSMAAVYLLCT